MSTHNNPPRDIDMRLQFLLTSTESLHSSLQEVHASLKRIDPLIERIDALTAASERHERDNARFNRMMVAALQAYLGEEPQQ